MCGLRDIAQRTVEPAEGDVGSPSPYAACPPLPTTSASSTSSAPSASSTSTSTSSSNSASSTSTSATSTSTLPRYGIDCEDGVVGAVDANGSVTGVLPGHWAGAPVDET